MYTLETGLESYQGTNIDDLNIGDLCVGLHDESKGHILLKVRGNLDHDFVIDLTDPQLPTWIGHYNVRVRKLSPGESITLTVA
ncbi:hypothetical protein LCGC14_0474640 [marine sediment metagenome]|uniref:Uncharacterized protein n=1 Tax=marine sediment metagenome TaxID=412755 RepID=A0A0F9SGI5_9ZZZZ